MSEKQEFLDAFAYCVSMIPNKKLIWMYNNSDMFKDSAIKAFELIAQKRRGE